MRLCGEYGIGGPVHDRILSLDQQEVMLQMQQGFTGGLGRPLPALPVIQCCPGDVTVVGVHRLKDVHSMAKGNIYCLLWLHLL